VHAAGHQRPNASECAHLVQLNMQPIISDVRIPRPNAEGVGVPPLKGRAGRARVSEQLNVASTQVQVQPRPEEEGVADAAAFVHDRVDWQPRRSSVVDSTRQVQSP
jgi:hypothetical protein